MFLAEGGLANRGQRCIEGVPARHRASGGRPRTRNALRHADQPPRHGRHAHGLRRSARPAGRSTRNLAGRPGLLSVRRRHSPQFPIQPPGPTSRKPNRTWTPCRAARSRPPRSPRCSSVVAQPLVKFRQFADVKDVAVQGKGKGQGAGAPLERLFRRGHAGHHPAGYHHHARDQLAHSPHR